MCLKAISARIPKTPLTTISETWTPAHSIAARPRSKILVTSALIAFIERAGSSADVAEAAQLLGDVRVALRVLELRELLLQHVHDELLVRGVARHRADLLDAVEEVLVELDLAAAAEHRQSPFL